MVVPKSLDMLCRAFSLSFFRVLFLTLILICLLFFRSYKPSSFIIRPFIQDFYYSNFFVLPSDCVYFRIFKRNNICDSGTIVYITGHVLVLAIFLLFSYYVSPIICSSNMFVSTLLVYSVHSSTPSYKDNLNRK